MSHQPTTKQPVMVVVVAKTGFHIRFLCTSKQSLIQSLSFIHSHHYLEVQALIMILLTYA
jgi:hypothetical protein